MKNNSMQGTEHTKDLNELLEQLRAHPGTTANAKVMDEIKGIMEIYEDVDPISAAKVMERVAVKLACALIDTLGEYWDAIDPGEDEIFDPLSEWENGFEAYLLFNGKTEKTIEVYLRCIKRIMKKMCASDINEMLSRVNEYECNGANERSALTQFEKCLDDGKGYVIVLNEKDSSEKFVLWRTYCTCDAALEELATMREEREVLGKDPSELWLVDKIGNKVNV